MVIVVTPKAGWFVHGLRLFSIFSNFFQMDLHTLRAAASAGDLTVDLIPGAAAAVAHVDAVEQQGERGGAEA